jgi:hypothetical protein
MKNSSPGSQSIDVAIVINIYVMKNSSPGCESIDVAIVINIFPEDPVIRPVITLTYVVSRDFNGLFMSLYVVQFKRETCEASWKELW